MNIKDLLTRAVLVINVNNKFTIDSSYYKDTEIIDLRDVEVVGNLTYPTDGNLLLDVSVSGSMIISDSVDLEPVSYPFSFEINENVYEKLEKDQNRLDIIDILWENIVLEIPIRYSKVETYENLSGDGWKVISEDDLSKESANNPFKDLLKEIEEE